MQTITTSTRQNWSDAFHSYLVTDYRKITHHQLNEKSVTLAQQHIRVFSLWYEATFNQAFDARLLTNYDLHLYRKWSLDEEKVKAATWNSRFWALSILCLWLDQTDLMEGVEQKQAGRASTKHRSLTDDEYHRLVHLIEQDPRRAVTQFEYLTSLRDWAAVSLMLQAGLRVEEVSLTQSEDITLGERSGNILVRNGKGSKERNVPLNLTARRALSQYMADHAQQGSLFKLTTRSLQRIVTGIGKRIGVPDLTPHWLRYTFAKRLETNNTPIETIRDLLGHGSIEITRRYLRSSMQELQSAVDGIE